MPDLIRHPPRRDVIVEWCTRYAKDGPRNQPFHPAMMVKVLIYGYATGVFSSRKLARKLHECWGSGSSA